MRNKEATKKKLISAVGQIINKQGHTGLSVTNIARIASVDRTLVYRYFGSLKNLIKAYLLDGDYWMTISDNVIEIVDQHGFLNSHVLIENIFQNQANFFSEVQNILKFNYSSNSELLRDGENDKDHTMLITQILAMSF